MKSKPKLKYPIKPTPYNLYHDSRLENILALGKASHRLDIQKICSQEYKVMPEEQKKLWILKALEKEPAYKVFNIFLG